jgi:glycosyltransferase involved in cell wall biosynthesis
MKIAIDALGIHYYGGGRSATLNLFEPLFRLDEENEYLVFLTQPEPSLTTPAGNITQYIAPMKNRFALRLWAQASIPALVHDYDLVHFAKDLSVAGVSTRTVVTIYDMSTLLFPHFFPAVDVFYWRHIQRRALHKADQVVAISQTTAQDLVNFYQLPIQKIEVVYPGCAPHFRPAPKEEIERVRQTYQLPDQFVLHLGRIDRRRNLSLLVKGFALFQQQTGFCGKLVLVGAEYSKSRDNTLHEQIHSLNLQEYVQFTGAVPDADVAPIYGAALVAVNSAVYEGFGIAALEAMSCGAPLIVNRAGAIEEVVGDAALVLQSGTATEMADALTLILNQPQLREEMRSWGFAKARCFDRVVSASQMLELYKKVATT